MRSSKGFFLIYTLFLIGILSLLFSWFFVFVVRWQSFFQTTEQEKLVFNEKWMQEGQWKFLGVANDICFYEVNSIENDVPYWIVRAPCIYSVNKKIDEQKIPTKILHTVLISS